MKKAAKRVGVSDELIVKIIIIVVTILGAVVVPGKSSCVTLTTHDRFCAAIEHTHD